MRRVMKDTLIEKRGRGDFLIELMTLLADMLSHGDEISLLVDQVADRDKLLESNAAGMECPFDPSLFR